MTKPTPGPWTWRGAPTQNVGVTLYSEANASVVMSCRRHGIHGSQLEFNIEGRMVPVCDLATFKVGTPGVVGMQAARQDKSISRYDVSGIDHPDARLISAAPELLEVLREMLESYDGDGSKHSRREKWLTAREKAIALIKRIDGGG